MTPRIDMPVTRQLPRNTDRPLRVRLQQWCAPVVYEVVADYGYNTWIDGKPVTLILPAGFRSDLASTPRLSWLVGFRPDGPLMLAGWYHDYYYRHGHLLVQRSVEDRPRPRFCGRGKTWGDRLLAQLAAETIGLRMPGWIARAALWGFGWPAWWANGLWRLQAQDPPWPNIKILHGDYDNDD